MMEDSHFLQQHQQSQDNHKVLQLHRCNISSGALLGKGSFSVVYEVQGLLEDRQQEHPYAGCSALSRQDLQQGLEGRFAMKHLRPDLVQKPGMFQAAAADLLLEAKYLAALDHPGILKLRAVAYGGVSAYEETGGQYDGYFLITDRLDGTLKDKIMEWQLLQQDASLLDCMPDAAQEEMKDNSMSQSENSLGDRLLLEKLDIARQMASALQYMHDRRLIFRDLKPPNVGLTADNRVRLFDFGFCRELPSWGGELEVPQGLDEEEDDALYYMSGKGSLMYLAPEVLYNGRYNRKADCYSFAMVLYELLTLNKPFHSVSGLEVFRELLCRHKARPPLEYSQIPPSLQDLLRHAWEDQVRDRWTMRQISQRLQEISKELDPAYEWMSSSTQVVNESDAAWESATCGFVDLIVGLAQDVKSGYKVLKNKNKTVEVHPCVEAAYQDSSNKDDQLTDVMTATTEDSSIVSTAPSLDHPDHSLRINAMTATEEPLEFTLEQAMTLGWSGDDDDSVTEIQPKENPVVPQTPCASRGLALAPAVSPRSVTQIDEDAFRDHAPLTPRRDMGLSGRDERCPPSPLERTNSAPSLVEHLAASTRNLELSPHYPSRQSRRQSWAEGGSKGSWAGSKGFFPEPESAEGERRQPSLDFGDFPESHFLPTAVQMRG